MQSSWIGKRVKIIEAEGLLWHGLRLADGRPEHCGKEGTIIGPTTDDKEWDMVPEIRLDDGSVVLGCECWWIPLGWTVEDDTAY